MGKKEIAVRVNITLPPSTLERIDKNVERIQQWLIRHGADEKDINKFVSRSSIIKEMAETLATEVGYESVLMGFKMRMGVEDNGQVEMFND
jgi:hypothetical protein